MSTFLKVMVGAIGASMTILAVSVMSPETKADISLATWNKPYTVRFGEWVPVHLRSFYTTNVPGCTVYHNISQGVGESFRYNIVVRFPDNHMGRFFYKTEFSVYEESLKARCATWRKQGYPISMKDFDIDVKMVNAQGKLVDPE